MFQSLSGNSSVVGSAFWNRNGSSNRKFQSLSGNSSVVGQPQQQYYCLYCRVSIPFREFKCCRSPDKHRPRKWQKCFNPFQGIQVLSEGRFSLPIEIQTGFQSLSGNSSVVGGYDVAVRLLCQKFQSLSGNSSVVGIWISQDWVGGELCFNPFQGIQVLSDKTGLLRSPCAYGVSIPFREFKCCRLCLPCPSRQWKRKVSIPFREFKCCRLLWKNCRKALTWSCFNPFQGIQVLSEIHSFRCSLP